MGEGAAHTPSLTHTPQTCLTLSASPRISCRQCRCPSKVSPASQEIPTGGGDRAGKRCKGARHWVCRGATTLSDADISVTIRIVTVSFASDTSMNCGNNGVAVDHMGKAPNKCEFLMITTQRVLYVDTMCRVDIRRVCASGRGSNRKLRHRRFEHLRALRVDMLLYLLHTVALLLQDPGSHVGSSMNLWNCM